MIYLIIILGLIVFIYGANLLAKRANSKYNIKLINLLKNNYLGWDYDKIHNNLNELFLSVAKIDQRGDLMLLNTKSANNKTLIIFQFHNYSCNAIFIQSSEVKFRFNISSDLNNDLEFQLNKKMANHLKINYDVNDYLPKKCFYNDEEPKLNFNNSKSYLFTKFDFLYGTEDKRYISYSYNRFKNMNYLLGLTPEYINSINDYIVELN